MAIVQAPWANDQAATLSAPDEHFVFRAVDWRTYRALCDALSERRLRLTYDGENFEVMTVSLLHDLLSRLLGRFLVVLTEEFGMPIRSAGSVTLERQDVQRGIQADESYYIVNEPLIRDKEQIDLQSDPPPDLGVEIDVSRSSLNRLAVHAALRIPEVWRFDGHDLFIHQLAADGKYDLAKHSRYFPLVPIQEIVAYLRRWNEMDENSLVRLFRNWVREHMAKGWSAS